METNNKIKYSLRNKKSGKLINYTETPTDADFSTDIIVELCEYGDKEWVCDTLENAQYVKHVGNKDAWYNSSMENPFTSDINMEEYEIVKLEIIEHVIQEEDCSDLFSFDSNVHLYAADAPKNYVSENCPSELITKYNEKYTHFCVFVIEGNWEDYEYYKTIIGKKYMSSPHCYRRILNVIMGSSGKIEMLVSNEIWK